jgi:hypothetical protein
VEQGKTGCHGTCGGHVDHAHGNAAVIWTVSLPCRRLRLLGSLRRAVAEFRAVYAPVPLVSIFSGYPGTIVGCPPFEKVSC